MLIKTEELSVTTGITQIGLTSKKFQGKIIAGSISGSYEITPENEHNPGGKI